MRIIVICALFLSCVVGRAQYYSITCDSQNPNEQFVLDRVFSGNTPFLRSYHYDNGVALDMTSWTMEFYYSYGQYDTNGGTTIQGVVTPGTNIVTYLGATNVFFQAFDKYYFSIKGTHASGYVKTFATGRMIQEYDPATDTNQIATMGALNMSWWTNNLGAQVESNRIRIAVFETNKIDRSAFSGTNLIFEGRITTNEARLAAQIISNALYEVRIASNETFRLTTQPATNAALQLQITGNLAAQANTNVGFQNSFTAQVNTNVGFQNFDTAQVLTNAWFQTLHDNQALTNIALLGLINSGGTGSVSLVTYAAHIAAQLATNSEFQTLFAAQANTNAGFQGRFDAQVDTNVGFQTLHAAQVNTNLGFQAAITNEQNTNTAQNVRLSAVEGYTNAAQTAYAWGAHSNAGYLTAGTNRFNEIFAANLALVGTNIAGLNAAGYTGVVTTIAFTGVTVLIQGNTYAWGFTKQNAYGTSTLSIGVSSISRTAAGACSNYFTHSGTDSNLVLRLDGDGSSKSDVSALYVLPVTGGAVNVAADLNIGGVMRIGGAILTNAAAHIAETAGAHGGTLTNWLTTVWSNALATVSNTAVGGSNLAVAAQATAAGASNATVALSNDLYAVTAGISNDYAAADLAVSNGVKATYEAADAGISNALALKLALSGGMMTGPVSNEAGIYGNGLGLTNVPGTLTTAQKAVATNALTLDGGVMRGSVTNTVGLYGNGLGLTNISASALPVFDGPSTNGIVASSEGDEAKYLKGDGTWDSPAGAGDFLADGSVAMTGPLDFGGQAASNIVALSFAKDADALISIPATNGLATSKLLKIKGQSQDDNNKAAGDVLIEGGDSTFTTGGDSGHVHIHGGRVEAGYGWGEVRLVGGHVKIWTEDGLDSWGSNLVVDVGVSNVTLYGGVTIGGDERTNWPSETAWKAGGEMTGNLITKTVAGIPEVGTIDQTIDWADGDWFERTYPSNTTLAFANVPACRGITVIVCSTNASVLTWPTNVMCDGAMGTLRTNTANKRDVYGFISDSQSNIVGILQRGF